MVERFYWKSGILCAMICSWTQGEQPISLSMPFLFLFSFLLLGRCGIPKPPCKHFCSHHISKHLCLKEGRGAFGKRTERGGKLL